MSRKILLFAGNPNITSAASSVVLNMINGFKDAGNNVFLMYINHAVFNEKSPEILDQENIIRIDCYLDNYKSKEFRKLKRSLSLVAFSLGGFISRILNHFFHYSIFEVLKAKHIIKKTVRREKIDTIFVVNHSYHTRERCLFRLGKHCKDIRCVWVELATHQNEHFFKNINRFITKNYIRHCDLAIFKTHIEEDKIVQLEFPMAGKYVDKNINCNGRIIRMGYFGSFHRNVREPFFLIQFANKNKEVEIDLFTNKKLFYNMSGTTLLPSNIHVFDEVGHNYYLQLLSNYDVLINIENVNTLQHPSKLYSYISTGLPILSIGIPDGFLHNLLLQHYSSYCFVKAEDTFTENGNMINAFLRTLMSTPKDVIDKNFYEISNEYILGKMLE